MRTTKPTPEIIAATQRARWSKAGPVAAELREADSPSSFPSLPSVKSVEHLPTALLTVHPALAAMPQLADDDPRFLSLARDIRGHGIRDTLKVDPQDRVIDGRHRLRAARLLKLETVPSERVAEAGIQSVIIQSLVQRRHYSKGALAYVVAQFLAATPRSKSYDILAEETGLSTSLLKQAFQLLEIFAASADGASYQAEIEPDLLQGETGLGAALAGWAGRCATKGQSKTVAAALDLWSRSWTGLGKRLEAWAKFDDQAKAAASAKLGQFVEAMPPDLLSLLLKRANQEKKRRENEGQP